MNHLLVGSAIPFIIACLIYVARRRHASVLWLVLTPVAMVLCATWAVLPDLPRTFGLAGYDASVSANPRIDIFFWHYTINSHETASPWYSVGFVVMVVILFAIAWRELRLTEEA